MAAASSKEATAYLIDPLTAPEPSAETGLGSHFVNPPTDSSSSSNPFRQHRSTASSGSNHGHNGHHGRHSRHTSTSSQPEKFPTYRGEAAPPPYDASGGSASNSGHRRRGSSLRERFPGDETHKPLDILRRDSKKAARSPHLSKRHMPGPDSIDRLDPTSKIPYHHEGPYDAASLARNSVPGKGPIDALRDSNREALKATPPENISDSLRHGVPLSGTAVIPPGTEDRFGRTFNYEEGANQMFEGQPEGGQYKRWDGVKYHPDDIEGKGEPYYSREMATNKKPLHGHGQDADGGIEMSDSVGRNDDAQVPARSGSLKDGLRRRIGSLKKH